jgi:hypothetical protein
LQRTVDGWHAPDLSEVRLHVRVFYVWCIVGTDICPQYDALVLDVKQSDGRIYTIVVKDSELVRRPDGRVASTISWEHDFHCPVSSNCRH